MDTDKISDDKPQSPPTPSSSGVTLGTERLVSSSETAPKLDQELKDAGVEVNENPEDQIISQEQQVDISVVKPSADRPASPIEIPLQSAAKAKVSLPPTVLENQLNIKSGIQNAISWISDIVFKQRRRIQNAGT